MVINIMKLPYINNHGNLRDKYLKKLNFNISSSQSNKNLSLNKDSRCFIQMDDFEITPYSGLVDNFRMIRYIWTTTI